jgi:hypothetical protein
MLTRSVQKHLGAGQGSELEKLHNLPAAQSMYGAEQDKLATLQHR